MPVTVSSSVPPITPHDHVAVSAVSDMQLLWIAEGILIDSPKDPVGRAGSPDGKAV